MTITADGIALIKSFEDCRLSAYEDGAGVWTIGWGHTGPEVVEGLTITHDQADATLLADLQSRDTAMQKECPLSSPAQHSAMLSLAFNIGMGNFRGSSVCRFHNCADYKQAAASFGLWNKVAGITSAGLVRRRTAEAAMYQSESNQGSV